MLTSNVKLGADASAAAEPVGGRVEGATTPNLSADLLSFARSKGAYGGLTLEGSVVSTKDVYNSAYMGSRSDQSTFSCNTT